MNLSWSEVIVLTVCVNNTNKDTTQRSCRPYVSHIMYCTRVMSYKNKYTDTNWSKQRPSPVPGSASRTPTAPGSFQQHWQRQPASWRPHSSDAGDRPCACSCRPPSCGPVWPPCPCRGGWHSWPPGPCAAQRLHLPGQGTAANIQPASKPLLLLPSPECGEWSRGRDLGGG